MLINVTRYEVDAEAEVDDTRFRAVGQAWTERPGWRGSLLFRSATDPSQMLRVAVWDSPEDRDRWHATETSRRMGADAQPSEQWLLVAETRPPGAEGTWPLG